MHILFFLKKSTFTCWARLKTAKPLTTAKQLIRKNFCLLFEKSGYFLGLNPPPPPLLVFVRFLRTPSPRRTYFLNALLVLDISLKTTMIQSLLKCASNK